MCSIKKPSVVADASHQITAPESAFGVPNFSALISKLKSTTARAAGKKADRREYNRKYFASERGQQVMRAYEARNRAKKRAHSKMYAALRYGDLVKPDRCEQCNATGKIEGHHDDYALPLVVRWLCRDCHKTWHRKNKALNG